MAGSTPPVQSATVKGAGISGSIVWRSSSGSMLTSLRVGTLTSMPLYARRKGATFAQKFAQPHERRATDIGPGGRGRRLAFGGGHEHRQKRRQHPPHQRCPTIGAAR